MTNVIDVQQRRTEMVLAEAKKLFLEKTAAGEPGDKVTLEIRFTVPTEDLHQCRREDLLAFLLQSRHEITVSIGKPDDGQTEE
jgi:hypothetical protein